ncbi:alpha/beta hydrolase [Psychroserpens algicola]|uniref:Esterase family protein n=1 Tax=Psychroserpens algicola TaxID=1719034 RepID=A0ABT0H475_9FLAO|nr:alpha/beta hydrolase-fold protein [Psychroserpens algicola]MCK8479181.1 esterase family protein [Psychroserpens algicola]
MNKIFLLICFCLCSQITISQVIYETIESSRLGESREIKIQLPRNYDPEGDILYPLVVVFDGDYLFEPIIGNADYHSYWGDMPRSIIVGVNQAKTREADLSYSDETYFPSDEGGSQFFEFIGQELIPYINDNYLTSDFRIVVGHDQSANFLNYYLFKDKPLFRGYIAFSPDLSPEMSVRLQEKLATTLEDTFYYLATSDNDVKVLREDILAFNTGLSTIENAKLHYRFDDFTDADHYSLVGLGIPKAINEIFGLYKPINKKEYQEKVLAYEGSPYDYLMKKYEDIEFFYGFEKKVVENDLRAILAAAKKKNDVEALKNLSKLARREYPESMISAYYAGQYYEMEGNMKKALQNYQSGLLLEASEFISKDMLLDKIYDIQDRN